MVDCTGLENRQRETVREFESHRFRQSSNEERYKNRSTPPTTRLRICACVRRINSIRRATVCTRRHQRGHAGRDDFLFELRCALRVSPPHITAFLSRESVALVSGQCGVPQWPSSTRPRLAVASSPAASLRGLGRVPSGSAVMYRRHSLHFCGRRARPLDFCWKVMALANYSATPATQTHRAARPFSLIPCYRLGNTGRVGRDTRVHVLWNWPSK